MRIRQIVNWLFKSTSKQLAESNSTDASETVSINFETDSLRFMFDAYLAEYYSIRREVELHTELHERNINYLLLILGAVFSLSALTNSTDNRLFLLLNSYPFLYLVLALVSLIFPILYIMRSVYVVTLENYQHDVLDPKIATISTMLSGHSNSSREFINWEKRKYPIYLQGPMKWLNYSARRKYRENAILFFLFGLFRYIFVSFPSVCFAVAFFITIKKWTYVEIISLIVFIFAALAVLGGIIYTIKFIGSTPAYTGEADSSEIKGMD